MTEDWENMADSDWRWLGKPLVELTHGELVKALITAGKMYYRARALYDDQCKATGKMMDTALKWRKAADND